jgi:protein gp37
MGKTNIGWCDYSFNPFIGCSKVSEGCRNCYAEALNRRYRWCMTGTQNSAGGIDLIPAWGAGVPRTRTSEANWKQPLAWNKTKICTNCGTENASDAPVCKNVSCAHFEFRRPRVFCASLADWLDPEAPVEWLADLLILIRRTPHLDWLLLTKRPELFRARIREASENIEARFPLRAAGDFNDDTIRRLLRWADGEHGMETYPGHSSGYYNVWVGTTVENGDKEKRITDLLRIPARGHFLSCEPLLGPVDIFVLKNSGIGHVYVARNIHWVICGGESGPHARPMHPDWARSLRDQCASAGVPFFFKQWGEWHPSSCEKKPVHYVEMETPIAYGIKTVRMYKVGKKAAGRLLDGAEHNEFPNQLKQ